MIGKKRIFAIKTILLIGLVLSLSLSSSLPAFSEESALTGKKICLDRRLRYRCNK